MLFAIRGATTIERDCKEEIVSKSNELFSQMLSRNKIDGKRMRCATVIISTTADIHAYYPAQAIRESGFTDIPLFSCTEPQIEHAMPLCIRILLLVNGKRTACKKEGIRHVYLHGAAALRPDLSE